MKGGFKTQHKHARYMDQSWDCPQTLSPACRSARQQPSIMLPTFSSTCTVTLLNMGRGWGKDMDEAKMQSAHTGAALVFSRNQALVYIGEPDPPGHSHVTTFATDGTNINFIAHYSALADHGALEYYQYPIASTVLTNSYDCKRGRRQLRILQDDARALSYALRDGLKGRREAQDGQAITTSRAPLKPQSPPANSREEDAVFQLGHPREWFSAYPQPLPVTHIPHFLLLARPFPPPFLPFSLPVSAASASSPPFLPST